MSHLRGVVVAAMQLYAGRDVYYGERTLARSLGISRQVERKKKERSDDKSGVWRQESKRGEIIFYSLRANIFRRT